MLRLPGEEGRREAKNPAPLAGLLDKVGDMSVAEEMVGLEATLPLEGRRVARASRVGSTSNGGDCALATRPGSMGAPVNVMVGLVADERFGGLK